MHALNETVEHEFGDKEWKQVNATIRLLTVATAQISLSLNVGDKSVDVVGDAFENMLKHVDQIMGVLNKTQQADFDNNKPELMELCQQTSQQMQSFIVAFQFYDELSQRLNHISHGLSGLSELIADGERFKKVEEWDRLKVNIREKYTIQDEVEMFDSVMKGISVEEALNTLLSARTGVKDICNEVEMF